MNFYKLLIHFYQHCFYIFTASYRHYITYIVFKDTTLFLV